MGSSLDALKLVMASVLSTRPWQRDPKIVPIPWQPDVVDDTLARGALVDRPSNSVQPLKLGILWSDGMVRPHPPIMRGLRMVVDAVAKAGHKASREHLLASQHPHRFSLRTF